MKAAKHIPQIVVLVALLVPWAGHSEKYRQTRGSGWDLSAIRLDPPSTPISKNLFGVNLLRFPGNHRLPGAYVGAWRTFDAVWSKVEPTRGQWAFAKVDADVADATQRGVDLDLILGTSPTWASARPEESAYKWQPPGIRAEAANLADWTNYVQTVATRYKGRVHTYELWNEPNLSGGYSGDVEHLVSLCRAAYQTLKMVDPTITVISPGFSPYSNPGSPPDASQAYIAKFLSMGGKDTFDVLGYHFYTEAGNPERAVILKGRIDKIFRAIYSTSPPRVWNTESGYPIENGPKAQRNTFKTYNLPMHLLTGRESQAFMVRSFVLAWAMGVQRFYWYCWGHEQYAPVDDFGDTDKPATVAFRNVSDQLTGSRMLSCTRTAGGLWSAHLQRPSGASFWIVWSDDSPQRLEGPAARNVTHARYIDGSEVPRMAEMTVGGDPVFLDEE